MNAAPRKVSWSPLKVNCIASVYRSGKKSKGFSSPVEGWGDLLGRAEEEGLIFKKNTSLFIFFRTLLRGNHFTMDVMATNVFTALRSATC